MLAFLLGGCINKTERQQVQENMTPGEATMTIIEHNISGDDANNANDASDAGDTSDGSNDGSGSKNGPAAGTAATPGNFIENRVENMPYYFIAIQNETNNKTGGEKAIEESYPYLAEMISKADEYDIKLTLMFSAQWAAYIVSSPDRMAVLNGWKDNGHEIAGFHRGIYDENWDGFTNYSIQEAKQIRLETGKTDEKYNGTLNDLIIELKKINPGIKSGCFNNEGLNDESLGDGSLNDSSLSDRSSKDESVSDGSLNASSLNYDKNKDILPDEIIYGTCSGFSNCAGCKERLADTGPQKGINEFILAAAVNGIERHYLSHFQITTQQSLNQAIMIVEKLNSSAVYGSVTQSAKEQTPFFYAYLDYLHSLDPEGLNSKTLALVIEKQLLPERTLFK